MKEFVIDEPVKQIGVLLERGVLKFLTPTEHKLVKVMMNDPVNFRPPWLLNTLYHRDKSGQIRRGNFVDFVARAFWAHYDYMTHSRNKLIRELKQHRTNIVMGVTNGFLNHRKSLKNVFIKGNAACLEWALNLALVHELYFPNLGKIYVIPRSGSFFKSTSLETRKSYGLIWTRGNSPQDIWRQEIKHEGFVISYFGFIVSFETIEHALQIGKKSSSEKVKYIAMLLYNSLEQSNYSYEDMSKEKRDFYVKRALVIFDIYERWITAKNLNARSEAERITEQVSHPSLSPVAI